MLPLKHLRHRKLHRVPRRPLTPLLDQLIYVVAFAGPIMTIPQVYDIWIVRKPSVNPLTWTSYLLIGFVWLYYGLVHKEKPIIFSNILGIITTGLVVLGALLYH